MERLNHPNVVKFVDAVDTVKQVRQRGTLQATWLLKVYVYGKRRFYRPDRAMCEPAKKIEICVLSTF